MLLMGGGLVACLYVKFDSSRILATSDNFMPLIDEPYEYEQFYPSAHLEKID